VPLSERLVIHGERVVLRAFQPGELDAWFDARMRDSDDKTISPVGKPDREKLRERVERSGVMRDGAVDLAIELDGRIAGEIGTYREVPERDVPPGTFFFGIGVFSTADRGKGVGTDAVRTLSDWLFREAGALRIETATAVSNAPMRGVLDRLGYRFDGVEHRWEVDWANYAVDREDWIARRDA
jgi:RimJ/RimL family protein N-acetyltransferase